MLDVELCERRSEVLREFSPENVLYRGEAFRGGPAGQILQGTIDLYDCDGYRLSESRNDLIASLTHNDHSLQSNVNLIKQSNGSINIRYMVRKSGFWTLAITDSNHQHIQGSPFSVEIVPTNVSPNRSTLHYIKQHNYISNFKEFLIQLKDMFDNNSLNGTEGLSVCVTGGGKVINVSNLNNGTYRIICYINESNPLSILNVKMFGKDVMNSPFNLTTLYQPIKKNVNNRVDLLSDCKLVLKENKRISNNLNTMTESYQKLREEVEISYTAARLGVVHSIPAVFTITDPNPSEQQEKRTNLIQQYDEINKEISEINEKLTNLQETKRELFDYLTEKYKSSREYYKEIVDEYNFIIGNVIKFNKQFKSDQKLRRQMTDAEVMKKFDEITKVKQSLKILQEATNQNVNTIASVTTATNTNRVSDERTNSTVPDKPNTLAFWLIEGKFRS